MTSRRCTVAACVALLVSIGGYGSSDAHPLVDVPPQAGTVDAPLPKTAVARVGTRLVTRRNYRHWFRVAAYGRPPRPGSRRHRRVRREAMEFLVEAAWVRLEAREHGLTVSRRTVTRQYRDLRRTAFRDRREFRRYLRRRNTTEADLRLRVGLDLLQGRLTQHAAQGAGDSNGERLAAIDRFFDAFRRKWRARTACAPSYRIPDCSAEAQISRT